MHISSSNLMDLSSGSIHLDIRRACCPKDYPHHHSTCRTGGGTTGGGTGSRITGGGTTTGGGMVTLSVSGTKVDPVHVQHALAYLSCHPGACPPLVRLDLTKTCLYDENHGNNGNNTIIMKRLRQVFAVHKLLKTVDFSWNKLGGGGGSDNGDGNGGGAGNTSNNVGLVQVLEAVMATESSIQQLYLYGNDICDTPDLKALGDLLIYKSNHTCIAPLRELHLGSNPLLGLHCARELARGLSHPHCALVELDLWCCRLGDDAGVILIRDGVQKNGTTTTTTRTGGGASGSGGSSALQVLRLNLNDLSYKSCQAITEMLAENQTLQVLNLDSNDQLFSCSKRKNNGDEDYDKHAHQAIGLAFAQVMGKKKNTGLRHLGLPHTGMTDEIAVAIFQNLQDNDTLRYLDIGYNNMIDRPAYAQMITSIPKLHALQYLRTHARSQIMNVQQLVTNLNLNSSFLRLTYICVGSVHDQNQMDDYFKRNKSLLQARAIVKNVTTTRHICASKTSTWQPQEEACTVPLGLWAKALHKFASSSSSSQQQALPSAAASSSSTSSTSISALYTLLQGQVPTWIQQYQQAKQEAEQAAAAAAAALKEEEEAAALKEEEEEQKTATLQQEQQQQQQSQTSTFKIKSRLFSKRRRISTPRRLHVGQC